MSAPPLLNAAGRRSPVTLPGYLAGRPPRNKGLRYPPDPPTIEEIVAVMRQAGDGVHGARMRALVVLLWRAGLRINEALTLNEHDLEPGSGSVLVRHGKGGRRREVGMDPWGWEHVRLGVTSIYLQGIDNAEIIATVHARRAPMILPVLDCGCRPSTSAMPRVAAVLVTSKSSTARLRFGVVTCSGPTVDA